ncbi:MBL fold hydrolase [Thermoanaerobacterium thermosaccharolyticum]|uniref:MBL fold metallo-hydrolase RNA specificity domain-containing protein n=1 Tax=Thermoanaerobacterium thermosaccharolyticum TaxID=1517 RepID=UPI000C0712B8|nr:MBL fold metallo-hydrolase [Thermoanaerobacterium thermosaccharolyticum]PHO07252.1 MBL fold hydrolase [Thermoanaerobacterium thermosaccharolyticum]
MKIAFLGAAKEVTGSCYLVETESTKFLVDCGMFQGSEIEDEFNYQEFAFDVDEIDFMLLTHAHIDHSGRIPLLYKRGYKKKIYATKGTVDLCEYMLQDSGHIQQIENEWKNRKRKRAGKPLRMPLYTADDGKAAMQLFCGVDYDEIIEPSLDVKVRFNDAGHMLGSSILEIWVKEGDKETKIVFSGDLGNKNIPILRDPTIIDEADYVVCESTYGDRLHEDVGDKAKKLMEIIKKTISRGGNVIIPSFAVGRTQELLYEIHKDEELYKNEIEYISKVPVYVDSPLATSVTDVFRKHLDYFDDEARSYVENGDYPLDFPNLHFTHSAEESKALNDLKEPVIIISASGMCEAGRIKHHLKHNLWRADSTIVFVGYQAKGTLGRRILEGEKTVNIFGEEITVNAEIQNIESFSGHADQKGLMDWISSFKKKPKKVFIVHGEDSAQKVLSEKIKHELNIETVIPSKYDTYDFESDEVNVAEIALPSDDEILRQIEELMAENDKILSRLKDIISQNRGKVKEVGGDLAAMSDALSRLKRRFS